VKRIAERIGLSDSGSEQCGVENEEVGILVVLGARNCQKNVQSGSIPGEKPLTICRGGGDISAVLSRVSA